MSGIASKPPAHEKCKIKPLSLEELNSMQISQAANGVSEVPVRFCLTPHITTFRHTPGDYPSTKRSGTAMLT